jgi:hypothetical protein
MLQIKNIFIDHKDESLIITFKWTEIGKNCLGFVSRNIYLIITKIYKKAFDRLIIYHWKM